MHLGGATVLVGQGSAAIIAVLILISGGTLSGAGALAAAGTTELPFTGIIALTVQARNLATTTGARIATTTDKRDIDLTIKDR